MLNHATAARSRTFDRIVQLSNARSFRLLLYVEWLLLALSGISLFLPIPPFFSTRPSFISIVCLVGFGLMGLRLPNTRLRHKILYVLLEFGVLFLPMLLGKSNPAFPFIIVIIILRNCQLFRLRECLMGIFVAFAAFSLHLVRETQQIARVIQMIQPGGEAGRLLSADNILIMRLSGSVSFGFMLLAVTLLVNNLLLVERNRQQLAIAHEQLRQYALRIESQATLQERNRIAREIHDSLGHALTAQSIQLENALVFCPENAEKTRFFLTQSRQLCSRALQEVRQSVATLRSIPPSEKSLEKLVYVAIQEFNQISEIQVECSMVATPNLPAEVNMMLYRILQEALINIHKHSTASEVKIDFQETIHHVMISIQDNGQGFDPSQNQTGFGLQGMQERAAVFNGQFHVISQPGNGCKVVLLIPLQQEFHL